MEGFRKKYRIRQSRKMFLAAFFLVGLLYSTHTALAGSGDTTPPTLPSPATITATVISSSQINLSWGAATDDSGIVYYDVYQNTVSGRAGATLISNGQSGTTFNVTGLSASSTYYFSVDARDPDGNTSGYTEVSATTSGGGPDTTPPTITSVTSSTTNGNYAVGASINITVNFSEAVTSTGNVTVNLETGTIDRSCTFTVSSAASGQCTYTVQSGDASSDLDLTASNGITGTIKDLANNSMTNFTPGTSLAANKAIVIDTTAPTNQDTVFPSNTSVAAGASVTVVSSGDATNNIWFAPSGTTNFVAGATMTTAGGTATSITAPATNGSYRMFVIDAAGNYSAQSTAVLTVTGGGGATYTITPSTGANGSVSCTPTTVNSGSSSVCTITPGSNYYISDIVVDSVSVGGSYSTSAYTYTFFNVTANHTISATFDSTAILSQSTYTSSIQSLANTALGYSVTSGINAPAGTGIEFRVRSCDDATCSASGSVDEGTTKPWSSCGKITSATQVTFSAFGSITNGSRCLTQGDGYVQYQVVMETTNTSVPTFGPVTIANISGYSQTLQNLISSPLDTGNDTNSVNSLTWSSSGTGTVEFQVRTAPMNSGGTGPDWANGSGWCGQTCNSDKSDIAFASDYITSQSTLPNVHGSLRDRSNDRWVQYAAFLQSSDGSATPTITRVIVNFSYNFPPAISVTSSSQIKTGTDAGKVSVAYNMYDIAGEGDSSNASSMLFYQPDDISLKTTTSQSGTENIVLTIPNTLNAATIPTSGKVLIDKELISYTGRTVDSSTQVTLTGVARNVNFSASYPTDAAVHTGVTATKVYFQATGATGDVGTTSLDSGMYQQGSGTTTPSSINPSGGFNNTGNVKTNTTIDGSGAVSLALSPTPVPTVSTVGANNLNGVTFTSATVGYMVGDSGVIYKTTDGGLSWNPQTSGVSNNLKGISFASNDANTGYIAAAYLTSAKGILKTTNAGSNWTYSSYAVAGGPGYNNAISCADSTHCLYSGGVSAGSTFTVSKTTDGSTWTCSTGNVANSPTATILKDTLNGYVGTLGSGNYLEKTSDGGTSFSPTAKQPATQVNGMHFFDTTHGYVVGNTGKINYSSDGFNTVMTTQTSGTTAQLNSVSFADANNGFVVGNGGVILYTTNGGTNWNSLTSGTSNNLTSVYAISPSLAIAVGASGTVVRIANGYQATGTYVSYMDSNNAGSGNTWTSLGYNITAPGNSNVTIKVQGSSSNASAPAFDANACSVTTVTQSGTIPLNTTCAPSNAQYLWYQATLNSTSDQTATPQINNVNASVGKGTPKNILWDAKTEPNVALNDVVLPNFKILVAANDGNSLGVRVGTSVLTSLNTVGATNPGYFDLKNPSATSFLFNKRPYTNTSNLTLTNNATDNSGIGLYQSNYGDVTKSDDFEDGSISSSRWATFGNASYSPVEQNGVLHFDFGDGNPRGLTTSGKYSLSGDFDVQVDFANISRSGLGGSAGIEIDEGSNYVILRRKETAATHRYVSELSGYSGNNGVFASSTGTSGKLRIIRTGSTIATYYYQSSAPAGWQKLDTITANANAVTVKLFADQASDVGTTSVDLDNFIVWSAGQAYSTTKAWTLSTDGGSTHPDGKYTVYTRYSDYAGNLSDTYSDATTLDTAAPTLTNITATSTQPYGPGATVTLQMNFTEPVIIPVGGITLTLNNTKTCVIPQTPSLDPLQATATPQCSFTVDTGHDTQQLYVTSTAPVINSAGITDRALNALNSFTLGSGNDMRQQGNIIIDTVNQERIRGNFTLRGNAVVNDYWLAPGATCNPANDQCRGTKCDPATLKCGVCGAMTDCGTTCTYNGDSYTTVSIGGLCWLAENLRTTKKPDGVTGITTYCNPSGCDSPWGRLYDWNTALNGSSGAVGAGAKIQGICPTGWHVASDYDANTDDFAVLKNAVSSNGAALKKVGASYWTYSSDSTDTVGFGAVGAGIYNAGYSQRGTGAYFWSSYGSGAGATFLSLSNGSPGINILILQNSDNKTQGLSVRCVKN